MIPEPKTPEPVRVDFSIAGERTQYIQKKLDDILASIGDRYSQRMTDELLRRLQQTILDFNSEVETMIGRLEKLESERSEAHVKPPKATPEPPSEQNADLSHLSDWERKLEQREREKEKPPAETKTEAPKSAKKGILGKK